MKITRNCCVLLLILFTYGCAGPEYKDLQRVTSTAYINITDRTYYTAIGALRREFQLGILPGIYELEKESSLGKFYRADQFLVTWNLNEEIILVNGGLFVPNDQSQSARIYVYIGQGQIRGSSKIEEVLKLGDSITKNGYSKKTPTSPGNGAYFIKPNSATAGAIGYIGIDSPAIYSVPKTNSFNQFVRSHPIKYK